MPKFPNIEAERARRGITKRELCRMVNVTETTMQNWQNGKTVVPLDKAFKLSTIFDESIEYLFKEA